MFQTGNELCADFLDEQFTDSLFFLVGLKILQIATKTDFINHIVLITFGKVVEHLQAVRDVWYLYRYIQLTVSDYHKSLFITFEFLNLFDLVNNLNGEWSTVRFIFNCGQDHTSKRTLSQVS